MTISTNDNENPSYVSRSLKVIRGALADALTLVRICLTPVIMFVIIKAWSSKPSDTEGYFSLNLELVLLASILFLIAVMTDILDDFIGGNTTAVFRKLVWFDDIADSLLIIGTLLSLIWVTGQANLLHWSFAVPVLVLFIRDIVIGLFKSLKFSKSKFQETRLGDIKNALAMFAVCLLVAAPWLSNIVDSFTVGRVEDSIEIYNAPSAIIWNIGLAVLWLAAILSVFSGKKLVENQTDVNEGVST